MLYIILIKIVLVHVTSKQDATVPVNKMPRCQFLFSALFVFQKSYIGNILGIGQNKSRSSYLPDTEMESKGETERSQRAAAPYGGTGYPLGAPPGGVGAWSTT
jgi:hypothetical protein